MDVSDHKLHLMMGLLCQLSQSKRGVSNHNLKRGVSNHNLLGLPPYLT